MNGVGTTFGPFIGSWFLLLVKEYENVTFTGGILFDCGGFPLPFIVSGGLLVFCALAAAIVLDPSEELRQTREEEGEEDEDRNIRGDKKEKKGSLFCSFPVILGLLITILTGAANQWWVNI